MLEIGSLIDGKYKVLNVVGKGGMSVVYQAVNEKANKIWAIKEVRKDGVQNFEVVKQNLVVETELLKRFNHPNLPSIIDVIDTEDSFLIVMDYIEGNSLSKAIETSGAQSQEDVIEWSKQLCDVLGYLHSRKPPIIYRDMKPANVMLKPDGNVCLIDFGTAREFKSSSVEDTTCLGTQGYAAPEQYGGHGQTDARTDIYCLGATMYHLVTGHNPSTPPYEMYPIRQWNPMLSSGLEEIIIKCTQRNPADRYQSCAELLYALDHYQDLDIENKKVQSFKWKTFMTSVILFIVMLVGTLGFKIAAASVTSRTYDGLLETARTAEAAADSTNVKEGDDGTQIYSEAVSNYKEAIAVEPSKIDAYKAILDLYMKDGIFTQSEYNDINMILKNVIGSDGKNIDTNAALTAADKNGYASLAKDLADDLFFCYESGFTKGISVSTNWYKKAKALYEDNEAVTAEIDRYMKIADCYISTNVIDAKGNLTINPNEVFNTIKEVVADINPDENILLSLKCCNFLSDLLGTKVDIFKTSVPENEYMELLDTIEAKLNQIEQAQLYQNNKNNNNNAMLDTMNQARSNVKNDRTMGYGANKSAEGAGAK